MKKKHVDEVDEIARAVEEAVQIEPLTLEEEFVRIPSDLARFNERYAVAFRKFLRAKQHEERTYARMYMKLREAPGDKKRSEAALRNLIENSDEYNNAVLHRIDAEVEKVRLHGVLDALRAKKDSLISIGAHIRAEMGGDPRIRGSRHRDLDDE